MLKKICALMLALSLSFVSLADAQLDDFAEIYNAYAAENGAEEMDVSTAQQDEDGWYLSFSGDYSLMISFDGYGEVALLMLECASGAAGADKAFLNAWYCADASLEYDDIAAVISEIMGGTESVATIYSGWYIAYQYLDAHSSGMGTALQYLGIVWVGEEMDDILPSASGTAEPSPTPTPSAPQQGSTPTTINGKTVYKA